MDQKVKIITSDSVEFNVDKTVSDKSEFLKKTVEDAGTEEAIILPNLESKHFKKILEYMTYYSDPSKVFPVIEKPLKSVVMKEVTSEYDAKFIEIDDVEFIIDIIVGANYLDLAPLLELGCAKIASIVKVLTPDEIKKKFNIPDTPEEAKERAEEEAFANSWEDLLLHHPPE